MTVPPSLPPVPSDPNNSPATPAKSLGLGLLLFSALILFITIAQVVSWANPSADPARAREIKPAVSAQERASLWQAYTLELFRRGLEPRSDTPFQLPRELREQIRSFERKSAPQVTKLESMAQLNVILDVELGQQPDPRALQNLADSKDANLRAFADAYTTPNPAKADAAAKASNGFTAALIRAQIKTLSGDPLARNQIPIPPRFYAFLGVFTVIVVIAFCGLAAFIILMPKLKGYIQFGPRPPSVPTYPNPVPEPLADSLLLRSALILTAYFFVLPLLLVAAPRSLNPMVLQAAAAFGFMLLVFALSPHKSFRPALTNQQIWGKREHLFRNIGIGALGYCINLPLALSLTLIGGLAGRNLPQPSHPVSELLLESPPLVVIFSLYIMACVVAPFFEEFVFRGHVFPALLSRFTPIIAAVICGFAFAAIHPQGPLLWPALAMVSVSCSFVAHFTRSIVPSITLHALHNLTIITLGLLAAG